jgi:hypothetical protein
MLPVAVSPIEATTPSYGYQSASAGTAISLDPVLFSFQLPSNQSVVS